MEAIRVTEEWQRAGVHYVRVQAMCRGFHIPLNGEINEGDTPQTPYVLVMDGITPVGTCRLHKLADGKTAKIERVCVLEEYRNRGAGRLAVTEAENWLREDGIEKVIITSRDEAVGFYQALGYTPDYGHVETGGQFTIIYTEKIL